MERSSASLTGPELGGGGGSEEVGLGLGFESLQFGDEIHGLISSNSAQPESASSFTALLELPPTQAVELLHDGAPAPANYPREVEFLRRKPYGHSFGSGVTFLSDPALIERAAMFSKYAGECSPETTSSVPSNSSTIVEKVKNEPAEADLNPNSSQPPASEPTAEEKNQRPSVKRKEREKKAKNSLSSSKKAKTENHDDAEKLPYVHVRARRGQATDSHSLAERARREKINARMKLLQELVPGCSKISGTALVLDEIITHVQSLQRQVEFLSMRLATVNPRIDFNLDSILPTDTGSVMDGNLPPGILSPAMWPEFPMNGNRQQYQQQWHMESLNPPLWGREEENHTFVTPENSLLTYDSSGNSASLQLSQLKMEL